MVSAICPNCHILLVEANNGSLANLGKAVNAAVSLGARFVSNSYSVAEYPGETADDSAYYDHPGVAVTAAAGDSGYGVGYPAASQYVTSVGGTSLVRATGTAARGWSETAWNSGSGATGSGCSAYEPKPSWQTDTGCRAAPTTTWPPTRTPTPARRSTTATTRAAGWRSAAPRRPLRSSPRPTPWPARRPPAPTRPSTRTSTPATSTT